MNEGEFVFLCIMISLTKYRISNDEVITKRRTAEEHHATPVKRRVPYCTVSPNLSSLAELASTLLKPISILSRTKGYKIPKLIAMTP